MEGKREFINKSCFDITVILIVRAGEKPGCCLRKEEFCLKCSECKTICFGSEANPFIDEIHVCSHNHSQCTETKLTVLKCGCAVDRLFNTNHHIVFLSAGQTIVISGHR